jgi:hypothetical protein
VPPNRVLVVLTALKRASVARIRTAVVFLCGHVPATLAAGILAGSRCRPDTSPTAHCTVSTGGMTAGTAGSPRLHSALWGAGGLGVATFRQ